MDIAVIGLDIAKRIFQAHGADASGEAVLRRKLQRPEVLRFFASLPRCLVSIEACGTAHHWAREIKALGHRVRLMPAPYVKPYVKAARQMRPTPSRSNPSPKERPAELAEGRSAKP